MTDDIFEPPLLGDEWRLEPHSAQGPTLWYLHRASDGRAVGRAEYREGLPNGPFLSWLLREPSPIRVNSTDTLAKAILALLG